ncbi:MAG TPA: MT-A70 family methyltransferase, partial [Galbitalea sp.]
MTTFQKPSNQTVVVNFTTTNRPHRKRQTDARCIPDSGPSNRSARRSASRPDGRLQPSASWPITRPLTRRTLATAEEEGRIASNHIKKPDTPKRFRVIYADPPWTQGQTGARRGAISKYDLMSVEQIKAMPVADLVADDATLLLWTTSNALPAALEVVAAWGFAYKTTLVWDKYYMGLGNYFRGSHEILLHGVRGKAPFAFHS